MTAVFHIVSPSTQKVIVTEPTREKAEARAGRIGADVRAAEVAEGARITVSWHGHLKPARVVGFKGVKVVASFVPRAGAAAVERAFPVAEVKF